MSAPASEAIDIVLHADGAAVEAAGDAAADVILYSDAATAMLVICGRLPLADEVADGRVRVEGNNALLASVFQRAQEKKRS